MEYLKSSLTSNEGVQLGYKSYIKCIDKRKLYYKGNRGSVRDTEIVLSSS